MSGDRSGGDAVATAVGTGDDDPGAESGTQPGSNGSNGFRARTQAGRLLFGDRVGLALFLGALCFGMLTWRAGIFITDNVTLARTLDALAEGQLWVERADGDYLRAPGAEVRDGRVYGRNYGQVVASLPALWLLQVVDAVANLRVALMAAVHLVGLAFAVVVSDLLGRRRTGTVLAAPLVLAVFVLNLGLATRFEDPDLSLLALQTTAIVATALGATVMYRLLAVHTGRRVSVLTGVVSVVALPVAFWAAIPKRHVFTVLVVLTVLYLFAVSRRRAGRVLPVVGEVPLARAGAYAAVGFLAWIHAAEGLFVFVVLVAVDLPTAPRNDLRSLAVIGVVFGLSMLPTALTNLLVTGEFARPPRTLGGGVVAPATGGSGGTGGGGGGTSALESLADAVPVGAVAWFIRNILTLVQDSVVVAGDPERVSNVFVRSAGSDLTERSTDAIGDPEFAGTNLSVLEAAPVLALVVAAAVTWLATVREHLERLRRPDPTIVLAVGLAVAFVALYLSRLPLHTQITQRYILPVSPLGLYVLARSPVTDRLVERASRPAYWTYAIGVLIGGQLVLTTVLVRDLPAGEAAQLNASLSLVVAALVVVTSLLTVRTARFKRATAVAVGLACAAGTVFVLVARLYYFGETGEAILPVVQELTDLLST